MKWTRSWFHDGGYEQWLQEQEEKSKVSDLRRRVLPKKPEVKRMTGPRQKVHEIHK